MKVVHLLAPTLLILSACSTSQSRLTIGDPAPPLAVSHWVKGEPVTVRQARDENTAQQGITVVEFWATWCGPCIAAIPHITEMQEKYANQGVCFVGVSAHDDGNTLEMVEKFVKKQGDKMDYRVAFDEQRDVYAAYMQAAQQRGIPTAFIIDQSGRVAWIGHPMSIDEPLERIVSGTFDIDAARKVFVFKQDLSEAYMAQDWQKVIRVTDRWIAVDPDDASPYRTQFTVYDRYLNNPTKALAAAERAADLLNDDPEQLATLAQQVCREDDEYGFNTLADHAIEQALAKAPDSAAVRLAQYRVLSAAHQDARAWQAASQAIALADGDSALLARAARTLGDPDAPSGCHDLAMQAIEAAIDAEPDDYQLLQTKFDILVKCRRDQRSADTLGRYIVEQATDEPGFLNNLAWTLLTVEPFQGQFNELALLAAQRCNQGEEANFMHLDTLALAQFENGKIDEAIATQQRAIDLCPADFSQREELYERLERFKQAQQ